MHTIERYERPYRVLPEKFENAFTITWHFKIIQFYYKVPNSYYNTVQNNLRFILMCVSNIAKWVGTSIIGSFHWKCQTWVYMKLLLYDFARSLKKIAFKYVLLNNKHSNICHFSPNKLYRFFSLYPIIILVVYKFVFLQSSGKNISKIVVIGVLVEIKMSDVFKVVGYF